MIHDVVIVGSGPAGYTAAIYAARAQLSPIVLAGSVTAGGALMNTTEVENYPGYADGIMGPELMTHMQEQAERFGADIRYEDVTALELDGDVKRVTTDEAVYEARTVIISTGSEYRKLGVDGEDRLSGHGVSYCATCDGFFFKDQDIVVVGGGDSAMEEATFLTRFARSVTVVHRRDQLRASAAMAQRAKDDPKIRFAWNGSSDSPARSRSSPSPLRTRSPASGVSWPRPVCSSPSVRCRAPSSSPACWTWTRPGTSVSPRRVSAHAFPASSPAVTSRIQSPSRPSPRPAPAAARPWMLSTTWRRWPPDGGHAPIAHLLAAVD